MKMKMKMKFIVLVLMIAATFAAEAQEEKKRIAVLPFEYGGGLTEDEAAWLTDSIRTALIGTEQYEVISNDQIENMMKLESKKQGVGSGSCSSEQCIIDLGNALECEKVLTGKASGAFGVFSITGKILDVVAQKYEKAQEVTIKNKNDFPQAAKDMVRKLTGFGDYVGGSNRQSRNERQKEREQIMLSKYPTREHKTIGVSFWLLGIGGGSSGYSVDWFMTPTLSIEAGGSISPDSDNLGNYYFGAKYSLSGKSMTSRWSPYFGLLLAVSEWEYNGDYYFDIYSSSSPIYYGTLYDLVIPAGFEFVAANGFTLALEGQYYIPIGDTNLYSGSQSIDTTTGINIWKPTYWFGIKLGWHF
ncbi:MAG: hypothetical protein OEZ13_02405 [Spirochaetia bacterium]|nr:hypothetical protein [Spirochaetia bacterium]